MNNKSGGIGMLGALQLVFIVLKLLNTITWSWWVVLIPLWIDLVVIVAYLIYLYCFMKNLYN